MGNLISTRISNFNLESPAPAPDPESEPEPAPSDANYNSLIELSFSIKIQSDELNEPTSNLFLAMFKGEKDEIIKEIGRTEVFEDSSELDLFWSNKLLVKYCFGDNQPLILRLYHVYPENHSTLVADLMLHEQKLLAESSVLLSQIVVGMESTCSLGLEKKQMRQHIGTLTVQAEETVASRGLSIKICTHMGKTNGISKKGQFLKVLKKNANGTANEICTTELVKNNPKPEWSVYLNMQQIGGKGDELIIEGYNFSSNHNHTLFGTWQAPVSDSAKLNSEESSRGLKKNRNSQLSVDILESHSFLDFIKNGYEIGLMVAVDFAVTDVDPEGLDSFHNIDSSSNLNAYQQVLKDIGGAIEHYNSDRRFPAWCFGGKTNGKMLSCFNLDPDSDPDSSNCVVKGVEGILKAYSSALSKGVKFHRPTSLSEVIKKASSFVSESCNCRKYYVLLIVTNGDLLGIQDTIDSLVNASNLPLSILIVGFGDDKRFEKMKKLCPGHLLKDFKGVLALRDIVRFMPKCNVSADERFMSCLEEIPKQFLTYMRKKGIKPYSI